MDCLPTIQRPTITLALIAKNEEKNVNRLLDSVEGCFDEIVFVDTGSTDKTKELALARGCKVYDFEWVDSFAKARNFAFSKATCDFICWFDLDDVLSDKQAFIKWRDHAMEFADYWLASYHYAVDANLNPLISFVRERVVRRSLNPTWVFDVHEGIIGKPEWKQSYITTWVVKHLRDEEDIKQDKSRNVRMFDKMAKEQKLEPRMQFYYGKELFEAGRSNDAISVFEQALEQELEFHDRMLALQYAAYASLACADTIKTELVEQRLFFIDKAINFCQKGMKLDPNRAEFHVLCADSYLRANNLAGAVPYLHAARSCLKDFGTPYSSPIFSIKHYYGEAPTLQLSKVYAQLGQLDKAKEYAEQCIAIYNNEEAKAILGEVTRISNLITIDQKQTQTEDIVFTCPPQNAYEFDEEIYKTKGMGGSETALIEMAKHLHQKTGRPVKVFNMRKEKLVAESGVEYIPNSELNAYMSKNLPYRHIAWRHNIKCTNAPTYLWCHDLFCPSAEVVHNFDKFLCLSKFHKNYIMGLQGVPEDKIIVTRNGLDPDKFKFERRSKNKNKMVWMSSPDRGLERAMQIADLVRVEFPDIELHVYYGIEGLYKYGPAMSALADKLKVMMAERPWVKYHGFTEQRKMYEEVSDAVLWLHPNNFIETFAITAIECLANGIFPVVRRLGALANTLADAESKRQAKLLDYAWDDPDSLRLHANEVCKVLLNRQWENIEFDVEKHAWAKVADEWIEVMSITNLSEAKTA